jgi:hypothetical protein
VIFDTVILGLTLYKLKDSIVSSGIGQQLVRDNIMYFMIVSAANIVVLIIECVNTPEAKFLRVVLLPYPTLITAAMGTR